MNEVKNKKRVYHILIFERETEEESVLTITKLLLQGNNQVTLFLSDRIIGLIGEELKELDANVMILDSELDVSLHMVNKYIEQNTVDLILFTRYNAHSFKEYKTLKSFVKNHKVCTLIDSYERWFSKVPPIKFNGWKIIKRSKLLDWFYCRFIFNHFACYFISDPHIQSQNPLKLLLQKRTEKLVFEIPFKVMEGEYKPQIKNEIPHFVIPGSVDKNRRDYFLVLKILFSQKYVREGWVLILLGRPIGKYGRKVIEYCEQINKKAGTKKIIYFDHYISKESFEKYMSMVDYIIAPVSPKQYKFGKDSGALYDIFKYNKYGIINKNYFYQENLPEIKSLLTYSESKELESIIASIIYKQFNPDALTKNFQQMNSIFKKENYLKHLQTKIEEIINI